MTSTSGGDVATAVPLAASVEPRFGRPLP